MDLYPEIAVAYGAIRAGSWTQKRLARRAHELYRVADCVISLGGYMTDQLAQSGADRNRIVTVHNWVPDDCVRAMDTTAGDSRQRLCVMYSGNLGLGHELETLVEGVGVMPVERRPELVFVGGGKREEDLKESALRHGIRDVRFEDTVPLDRLSASLSRADTLVVAQRPGTEGLIVPSKIYSALAAGRPILFIGPSECEVADIVRAAEAGFIVAPGDTAGIAEALGTLSDSPPVRRAMGAAGRDYYELHFRRESSIEAILESLGALED